MTQTKNFKTTKPRTNSRAVKKPIVRNGLAMDQTIFERIQVAILEQRLPPGSQLTEERLVEVFHVSRARIRRVLLRLSESKNIILIPNRGAFVAQPTPTEVHEVFTARRIIEAHIVKQAAHRITDVQRQQLEQHLDLERDAHDTGNARAAIRLSGEFHLLLAEIAGNEVLARFLYDLVAHTSLAMALYGNPSQPACGEDEHELMLEAISSGHVEKALALMDAHLESIELWLQVAPSKVTSVDLHQVFAP